MVAELERKRSPRFLSNEGYNLALRAAGQYGRSDIASEINTQHPQYQEFLELRKGVLLGEQAETERAIYALRMDPRNTRPSCIPGINEIFNKQPLTSLLDFAVVEVVGMFGAGKTSFLEKIKQLGNPDIVCLSEAWSTVKKFGKEKEIGFDKEDFYASFETAGKVGNIIIALKLLENAKNRKGIALFDRLLSDTRVFTRARILAGDLDPVGQNYLDNHFWLNVEMKPAAEIVLMVPSYLSLARHPEEGIGRYRNLNFLDILYQSYLRHIYETREHKQPNFAVLNMSGVDFDENWQLFKTTLEEIIGRPLRKRYKLF